MLGQMVRNEVVTKHVRVVSGVAFNERQLEFNLVNTPITLVSGGSYCWIDGTSSKSGNLLITTPLTELTTTLDGLHEHIYYYRIEPRFVTVLRQPDAGSWGDDTVRQITEAIERFVATSF